MYILLKILIKLNCSPLQTFYLSKVEYQQAQEQIKQQQAESEHKDTCMGIVIYQFRMDIRYIMRSIMTKILWSLILISISMLKVQQSAKADAYQELYYLRQTEQTQ